MRVLILDDHDMFREAVGYFLETVHRFEVHKAATEIAAIQVLQTVPIEVVLLDYELADSVCIDFIRKVRELGLKGRILIVTAGLPAFRPVLTEMPGISGVILKSTPVEELARCIQVVAGGAECWDPRVVVEVAVKSERRLTEKEQEAFRSIANGLSNKEIAGRLNASEATVKGIVQRLFQKTGTHSRSQLVRVGIKLYGMG